MKIRGYVEWVLLDASGLAIRSGHGENVVTTVGKQTYLSRGAGVASPPAAPVGAKLGTGSTTPSVSGAGAALTTYLTGSAHAFDTGYPQLGVTNGLQHVQYKITYSAGQATSASPITEVVLINDNISDITSPEANTLSRFLVTGVQTKAADQSLVLTWTHEVS